MPELAPAVPEADCVENRQKKAELKITSVQLQVPHLQVHAFAEQLSLH